MKEIRPKRKRKKNSGTRAVGRKGRALSSWGGAEPGARRSGPGSSLRIRLGPAPAMRGYPRSAGLAGGCSGARVLHSGSWAETARGQLLQPVQPARLLATQGRRPAGPGERARRSFLWPRLPLLGLCAHAPGLGWAKTSEFSAEGILGWALFAAVRCTKRLREEGSYRF